MGWFQSKPTEDEIRLKAKQDACKHQGRFVVLGSNRYMFGTCCDCGKEMPMDEMLNVYFKKMDAILDKHGVE